MALIQGERKRLEVWINNTGVEDVSEVWIVSGPENVVWIETPAAEEPEGEISTTELTDTNPPVRLETGGFPIVEQRLKSCAVADTNRGLHRLRDTETEGVLQTPPCLSYRQSGGWEHLLDVCLPPRTLGFSGQNTNF